jgi:acetate kinase
VTVTKFVAVLNAGSSSIKFALYPAAPEPVAFRHGQIEGIGVAPKLSVRDASGATLDQREWPGGELDHGAATRTLLRLMADAVGAGNVAAVGHRVVHGGTGYAAPARVDAEVMQALERLVPLAPLHQPHNLAPIAAIAAHAPALPQVACFDTAFHRSQPPLAQEFALPRAFTEEGVRRYGFHGLSYEYIVRRLPAVAPAIAQARVIVAHLGNGASLCAVHQGRSVASTMGFTAVDGLMMGTRCGAIDPGVLVYLMDAHGMDARAIEDLIYRRSGLLGVSGISPDMRALRQSDDPRARQAIDLFVYRVVREIGSLAAALSGLDGLVFTAGIGEHDAATRSEVAAGCAWLGAKLDATRNQAGQGRISAEGAKLPIYVIPTDEESMIARHTIATLALANHS